MSPYSVQMREDMDQKNSKYGHLSRSAYDSFIPKLFRIK